MTLYHATYERYVPSILSEGLTPGRVRPNWSDSRPDHVYLTRDSTLARFFAETSETSCEGWPIRILSVRVDSDVIERLRADDNIPESDDVFQFRGSFPPDAIAVLGDVSCGEPDADA